MKPKRNLITVLVVTILVTMFGQTDVARSQVVTDGLLSYWTFDAADIDGQTAKDAWGDRDGTIIGNTQVTAGRTGDALQFDGAGDYVEYDDAGLPEGNAPRTMSVWIKSEGGGVRSALEWGTSGSTLRCGILVLGNQRIKFVGQNADVTSVGSVVNGEWHYVSEAYDGTTMRIYIDGVLDIEQAVSINTTLNVGRIGSNVRVGEFFEGAIDEVSIYDRALSADEVAQNFAAERGLAAGGTADVVYPEDGAIDVPREAVLSWKPGEYANTHDVYFGTSFDDVNNAAVAVDLTGVYRGRLSDSSYAVGERLELGETYYWRIDEVNAAPDYSVFKGNVWQFAVEPVGYPVDGANITATASSSMAGSAPERTIDGSGLDDSDLHSINPGEMWLSDMFGTQPTWIEYQFDKVYKLHEMSVWNQNQMIEPSIGYGFKDVSIEYSADGIAYTTLGTTREFARGPGAADYAANTNVDFGGAAAKYVKLTVNSGWESILSQYGLSEVRFSYIPVVAREPSPDSGATDADADAVLSFRAGREAATHDAYLSTDEQAVIDGTAPVVTVTEPSYASSLDLASTYYWRVDEVNDAEMPTTWQGDLWNFTTQESIVVDGFESYNDIPDGEEGSNLVYVAWVDGFDNPSVNGSTMGYVSGTSLDTDNVHDGSKSVPLAYNNTTAGISEVVRTFTPAQNWTAHGVKTLSLWFAGDSANVPGQLYVKVNGVQVNYDGDAGNLTVAGWQPWNIDLTAINTNLSNVTSLAIGIQGPGATGTLLLDDIRLYSYDRQFITPVDPGTAGLQAHYEFEGNTNDSSDKARHGANAGDLMFGEGKIGQAINFDGFISDYVSIIGYKGLTATNDLQPAFSIACWLKTSGDGVMVSWGSGDGTPVGGQYLSFRIDGGRLRVEHGNGNLRGNTYVNDGQWHHCALIVVEDGNLRVPQTMLCVDGQPDTVFSGSDNIYNITPDADVSIGRQAHDDSRYITGQIDEVRIYDRALTQEEIAWLAGRTEPFDKPF